MSASLKRTPAAKWKQEFYADELKEDRKADLPARRKASNLAAAFEAFCDVAGYTAEARRIIYILLNQSKGKAPDEEVMFSETEAGRLLPGDDGAAEASFRKRFVRAFNEILVPEMARTGKRIARRVNGSITLATRHTKERKQAPVYFVEVAQAVVDIERSASKMNGLKRDVRFHKATLEVWANLPDYQPTEEEKKVSVKVAQGPRPNRLAGRNTRRMARFQSVTKEMIREAQREGTQAVEALRERLHAELETMFADCDGVTKSDAPLENEIYKNAEENCEVDPSYVDGAVHVETEIDSSTCVACGEVIHPERLEFDTELCDLCGPPRIKEKPTAFRLLDEHEKRKKGQSEIIYAEDFTV